MNEIEDLKFPFDINHVFKYKNGTAYYILEKLKISPMVSKIFDVQVTFYPELFFKHATNTGKYTHDFMGGETFSDKFEIVSWDKIDRPTRIDIVTYNNFEEQVNTQWGWKYPGSTKTNVYTIEKKITEIVEMNKKNSIDYEGNGIGIISCGSRSNIGMVFDSATNQNYWDETNPRPCQYESEPPQDTFKLTIFNTKKRKRNLISFDEKKPIILK